MHAGSFGGCRYAIITVGDYSSLKAANFLKSGGGRKAMLKDDITELVTLPASRSALSARTTEATVRDFLPKA